jgi:arylsulfatase A-like enzyme
MNIRSKWIFRAAVVLVSVAAGCQPSAVSSPLSPGPSERSEPAATASAAGTALPDRPNILLIIADDFGIDASPCYQVGLEKPNMPNLQSLCDEGLVFDSVWVNPQCTPSRATFLTGLYAFRTGVFAADEVLADHDSIFDLLATEVGYPYPNAVIGKWHIGGESPDPNHPATFGVQHFFGSLSGFVEDYSDWTLTEDGQTSHTNGYATTVITDEAIEWVGDQGTAPWFLWLSFNAPHWYYHLPPTGLHHHAGLSGRQADIDAHPRAYFLAMAEALDTEMGRLLDSLAPEVRANTTILFAGDNGTESDVVQAPFDPERAKATVYEGGVRVPLVVAGRGVTRTGEREDALINGTDIFATTARLGGYPESMIHDGVSFDEALTDASFEGRQFIYTEFANFRDVEPAWAVRDARYKLIQYESGRQELFDLRADPFEGTDLLADGMTTELRGIVDGLAAHHDHLVGG